MMLLMRVCLPNAKKTNTNWPAKLQKPSIDFLILDLMQPETKTMTQISLCGSVANLSRTHAKPVFHIVTSPKISYILYNQKCLAWMHQSYSTCCFRMNHQINVCIVLETSEFMIYLSVIRVEN